MKKVYIPNIKIGLLQNFEYLKLLFGQLLAHFGDSIMQIALIAWIVKYLDIAGKEIASVFSFFWYLNLY